MCINISPQIKNRIQNLKQVVLNINIIFTLIKTTLEN